MENKQILLSEIFNTLETIKQKENINIYNILKNEVLDIMSLDSYHVYISYDGNYCIRCMSPVEYYFMFINKLNLKNKWIYNGLSCESNSKFYNISWTEHDFTIAFKKTKKFKNIYLLKMGADKNELNHRIRFESDNVKIDKNINNVCIDFLITNPIYYKNGTYKTDTTKNALGVDIYIHKNNNCYRGELPENILNTLEKHNAKTNNIIYNYDNILKIINYYTNKNYNNIILLDCRYIKNFDFNIFKSDNFEIDFISYFNALNIEKYAHEKIINELKPGVKYDNTSYYFNGDNFEILIHYNCYNDIINIKNINDIYKAKKEIDSITRPDHEIKKAISQHNLNTNTLYF